MDKELETMKIALKKINDIRIDIIARQTISWPAHVYPLVAALNEAGFECPEYEEIRDKAMTLIDLLIKTRESVKKAFELCGTGNIVNAMDILNVAIKDLK